MIFGHSGLSDFFRGAVVSSSLPESSNVLFPRAVGRAKTRRDFVSAAWQGIRGFYLSFQTNFIAKNLPSGITNCVRGQC